MKQLLTTKPYFNRITLDNKYSTLHKTELKVQRLERIIESLLIWREGSDYYKEAVADYEEYKDESL